MAGGLYTIPAGVPFAETLARGVIDRFGASCDPFAISTTIYLPTRRAARTLSECFARLSDGAALLPDIRALGDPDEEELYFDPGTEDLALAPALDPLRRRLLLAMLVRRWAARHDDRSSAFAQAAAMARHLARLFDEAEIRHVDLGRLDSLVPEHLTEHWAEVRDFLRFLRDAWPVVLSAEGALDPAHRRNMLIGQLARRYRESRPAFPVVAAGTTGSIPATADLLAAIAELPQGAVVLPALDRELDDESWEALGASHPQYGMKQLLASIGVPRGDVGDWPGAAAARISRVALFREVLRPAPTTDAWRALVDRGAPELAEGVEGIGIVEAAHPAEEALAIALILREALEDGRQTAALVTPDRGLARRVAAELGRWDIGVDDSAGKPLSQTPPAVFLLLLAEAAAAQFAPMPLLALLKHPLACGGEYPGVFRRRARLLDRFVLRGPSPDAGLAGISSAIASRRTECADPAQEGLFGEIAGWYAKVAAALEPFGRAMQSQSLALADLVRRHRDAAEALGASDHEVGAVRLWRGDAGDAAAELVESLIRAGEDLPPIEPLAYPILLRQFAEEKAVRPAFGRHPRLAILGPLEARLQHFDLVVLGGLNEGTWPRSAAADPWLSRPMRSALGLESSERAIGLAAHDFATLAAMPEVRFTRALKSEGAPTVESRWLQRLKQLTKGLKLDAKLDGAKRYGAWAALFAVPEQAPVPALRPAPRPPVEKRPRTLSVTKIETWLRDPYAIYARYVLRLKPLDPLAQAIGPMDRGRAMHEILERFVAETADGIPPDSLARLIALSEEVFSAHGIPQSVLALWRPRFRRAAAWFVEDERRRRVEILRSHLEVAGRLEIAAPGGIFILTGRADRIDELRDGGATVVDYKTGKPPTDPQVRTFAAQLPLEGAMEARGGFEGVPVLVPSRLVYIRFAGGELAGETHVVDADAQALSEESLAKLAQRIADFDREETPYFSHVAPYRTDSTGDYDHLARVREWVLAGREG
ncbi:MAG: double-strand break repair protein AddB [Rhizomicrobium sp.]